LAIVSLYVGAPNPCRISSAAKVGEGKGVFVAVGGTAVAVGEASGASVAAGFVAVACGSCALVGCAVLVTTMGVCVATGVSTTGGASGAVGSVSDGTVGVGCAVKICATNVACSDSDGAVGAFPPNNEQPLNNTMTKIQMIGLFLISHSLKNSIYHKDAVGVSQVP